MNGIYALFTQADDVQRAVDGLRAAGLTDPEIIVISSEPMEGYEFSRRDRATWMYWIAAGGGAIGFVVATWLTRMTELAWPLPTGNMPIVSWWPNLIIMFELTMLGSMLATVITMFISAKIPTRVPTLYDPTVSDGKILVGIENPPESRIGAIESALLSGGRTELKRV